MVVPEVLATGSPSQKSAQEGRVLVVQEGSDDNNCGTYAQVSDVSFTYCLNSVRLHKINNYFYNYLKRSSALSTEI